MCVLFTFDCFCSNSEVTVHVQRFDWLHIRLPFEFFSALIQFTSGERLSTLNLYLTTTKLWLEQIQVTFFSSVSFVFFGVFFKNQDSKRYSTICSSLWKIQNYLHLNLIVTTWWNFTCHMRIFSKGTCTTRNYVLVKCP